MELPKKFQCPNRSFIHSGEDKTVIEEVWKDQGKKGDIPYQSEFVVFGNPAIQVFGVKVVVILYDFCTECGTRFARQMVEGKANLTTSNKMPRPS